MEQKDKRPEKISRKASSFVAQFLLIVGVFLVVFFTSYFHSGGDMDSQQYALSALFQGMAAIFALVLTGVLVVSQIISSTYGHRTIKYFFNTYLIILLIALSSLSMFYPLLLLNFMSDRSVPPLYMAQALSISAITTVFSGIFIYNIVVDLNLHRVFLGIKESAEKETESIERTFQIFSDIIIPSIYRYDTQIVREGIYEFTMTYLNMVSNMQKTKQKNIPSPYENISWRFIAYLKRFEKMADKRQNGEAIIEVVKSINIAINENYKANRDMNITSDFSSFLYDILSKYKSKDNGVYYGSTDKTIKYLRKIPEIKRENKQNVIQLSTIFSPIIKIYKENPQDRFVASNLFTIAKEFAETGREDLYPSVLKIVSALEDSLEYLSETRSQEFETNLHCISDIIKISTDKQKHHEAEDMLIGLIPLINMLSKGETTNPRLHSTLKTFIQLWAELRHKQKDTGRILERMGDTIEEKSQRTKIITIVWANLDQERYDENPEIIRALLGELKQRWRV